MRTAPTTVQPAPFLPETPHAASSWRTAQTPLSPASAASSPNPTHQSPAPHCTSNQAVFCRGSLTNNLKLMRRQVVEHLYLEEPGFAINGETGLQPLLMGFRVKEVPISWIGRDIDMGVSSFRVFKVGGGYWRVLYRLWLWRFLKTGPYAALGRRSNVASDERVTGVATTR